MSLQWSFVERDELSEEQWAVQIKEGDYSGVVYSYSHVKLNPDNESIDFDYEVLDYHGYDDPTGEPSFNSITGDILQAVLKDAFEKGDYVIGNTP